MQGRSLTNVRSVGPHARQLRRMPWQSSTRLSATNILPNWKDLARKITENWNTSMIFSSFFMTSYRRRSRNPKFRSLWPRARRGRFILVPNVDRGSDKGPQGDQRASRRLQRGEAVMIQMEGELRLPSPDVADLAEDRSMCIC